MSGCSQQTEPQQIEQAEEAGVEETTTMSVETSIKGGEWCSVGSYSKVSTVEGVSNVKITGFEKFNIEGKELNLCCGEVEVSAAGEEKKEKLCYDENVDYSIVFVYNAEKGEYVKTMVKYIKDGKSCYKMFDENGNFRTEFCEGEMPEMPGMN